jgi:hypothetical protein
MSKNINEEQKTKQEIRDEHQYKAVQHSAGRFIPSSGNHSVASSRR